MALNLDHIRRYTGEDDALIAEVLGLFREQTSLWLRALDPEADDESWRAVAHAIKGSARTLGADALGELCARAEAMVGADSDKGRRMYIRDRIERNVEGLWEDILRWTWNWDMRRLRE